MRTIREPSERTIRIALAAFALAIRIPLLLGAHFVTYDGTYYINQANALLHGSFGGGAFPIGYPLLIAPVMAIVRDGVLAAALVSLIASVASVLVFESLCRRRMRAPLAIFAAALFAAVPLFARVSVLALSEPVYTLWVLLALHQFGRRSWATGLAIGAAAATRPEAVAIAGVLGIAYVVRVVRSRDAVRAVVTFALAFVLLYGASIAAMSVAHGRVTMLSRANAFRSVELPWQLRERTVAYEGKERVDAAMEDDRRDFDRGASYAEVAREFAFGLTKHLLLAIPILAVAGLAKRPDLVASMLLPLIVIPFFTEARGNVRWLVPYLAPLVYYAISAVDAIRRQRARDIVCALVGALAIAAWWLDSAVLSTGIEPEYQSTRDVAQRFATNVAPGDAIADRKPYFAFYAGARYVEIPAAPYDETIAALSKDGVRYLVAHDKTIDRLRPALRALVFDEAAVRGELRYRQVAAEPSGELVYERTGAVDSLAARKLTSPEIGDLTPAWSPDGSRIAFRRYVAEGDAAVMIVDRDGDNLREIARSSRERDAIAWSLDATHLICATMVEGNLELVSFDARSGAATPIVPAPSHEWSPSFSRTTGALVFCSDRDGTPAAWMLARGARTPTRVTPPDVSADLASVSPSGDRIAWVDVEGRLIFWNIANGEGMGVFDPRGVVSAASWSPDERVVVVEAYDWGAPRLYLVDSDTGRALLLMHSRRGEGMPSWSPDGREIVAVSARNGTPSVWVFGSLSPYIARLGADYRVATLQRPEALRSKVPDGLRRVVAKP